VLTSANPGNAALCLSVSQPSEVMPGTPTCGPFSEGGSFTRANGQTVQVRGPFGPQFDAVTYQKTIGNANYNALEASLRHNSKSLEVMVGYTYSKSLDDSSSLAEAVNPMAPGLSKALSAFDLRHNFVVSYKYNLPLQHRASRDPVQQQRHFAAGHDSQRYQQQRRRHPECRSGQSEAQY
jgi:hypothetical protein